MNEAGLKELAQWEKLINLSFLNIIIALGMGITLIFNFNWILVIGIIANVSYCIWLYTYSNKRMRILRMGKVNEKE